MRILFKRWALLAVSIMISVSSAGASDLKEILDKGELRHLGVRYARFVTGSGDGFSCDLIKLFAKDLGVKYVHVESSWSSIIGDLTGESYTVERDNVTLTGKVPIKGDLIASGLTILPWREKLINYSDPTFPSGVWVIAAAESTLQPIKPTEDIKEDIKKVKVKLKGRTLLCMPGTCLDPELYDFDNFDVTLIPKHLQMNEFAPAILNGKADTSLLDVADTLIALEKWPGKIKVIGPISMPQRMGAGFAKSSPLLKQAFNKFLRKIMQNGSYTKLVDTYYPGVQFYFPEFFRARQ